MGLTAMTTTTNTKISIIKSKAISNNPISIANKIETLSTTHLKIISNNLNRRSRKRMKWLSTSISTNITKSSSSTPSKTSSSWANTTSYLMKKFAISFKANTCSSKSKTRVKLLLRIATFAPNLQTTNKITSGL